MQEKEKADDVDPDSHRCSKEESLQWDLVDEMVHSLGRAWPVTKDTQGRGYIVYLWTFSRKYSLVVASLFFIPFCSFFFPSFF